MSLLHAATVSDVHIGHRRVPAREIVQNLYQAFQGNPETKLLQLIVIVGDLFDDLLTAPNEAMAEIDPWIASMLRFCAEHGIVLRVLEGTPSHDWRQSERFNTVERLINSGADFKYVKELSIEYIEKLDIHALYVPDEWETSTEKTLEQVDALLRAKGLEQVDYAFMHGQFEYQLPDFVKAQKHSSAEYLRRVKHLICIGHVHTFSRYERIIAQGSFPRLTHGEEEPKGHVRFTTRQNASGEYEYDVRFIENTGAKKFVTVNCIGLDLETTIARVDERARELPEGSFVRVEAEQTNPILVNMEMLIKRYPEFTWSKLVREEKEEDPQRAAEQEEILYVPITLTKDNLGALLLQRVSKQELSPAVLGACEDILKEVL